MLIGIKTTFFNKILNLAVLLALVTACSAGMDEATSLSKAREYYQSRDFRAALIELKNVLQANPQSAEGRFLRGNISLRTGYVSSAEKDLHHALKNGWDPAETQLLLAEVLYRKSEYQAVLDTVSIKDSYPDNIRAEFLGLLASAEQALGKWKDSEGTVITAETIHKNTLWGMKSRARLQLFKGDAVSSSATVDRKSVV